MTSGLGLFDFVLDLVLHYRAHTCFDKPAIISEEVGAGTLDQNLIILLLHKAET